MPAARAKKRPDLERDTPIVAIAAARAVIESRSVGLDQPLPDSVAVYLARRAHVHYIHSPSFRRVIRARGNRGRDTLYAFMHHWLDEWFGGNLGPDLARLAVGSSKHL